MPAINSPVTNAGKLKKTDWLLIGISWLLVQIILLRIQGINDQGESVKYILLADNWVKGNRNFSLYNIFYSGYTSIHVLLRYAGLPQKSMYLVQVIFSGLAAFYYTRILTCFLNSRLAILFSALLYTTCYIIQSWVSLLYTDSIFSSLLLIATYFMLAEEKSSGNKWVFWVLLLMLPFFRPVGFLFIPVACFHWIMLAPRKNINKLLFCLAYFSLIAVMLYQTFANPEYYYPLHNIQANVICGYSGDLSKYQVVPYREGMSTFSYLFHNPGMTIRLFLSRFYKVFSMGRPYFARGHNLLLFGTSFVYYVLAAVGAAVIFLRREKNLYFIVAGILLFSLPLIIFCVEWAGRFSLPVICYTLLLSSIGIDRIIRIPIHKI